MFTNIISNILFLFGRKVVKHYSHTLVEGTVMSHLSLQGQATPFLKTHRQLHPSSYYRGNTRYNYLHERKLYGRISGS